MRKYSVVPKNLSPLSQCCINPKSHWCTSKASPATLKRGEGWGGMEILCDFSQNILSMVVEAYGFETDVLNLVYDYLPNRKQRVKINETKHLVVGKI